MKPALLFIAFAFTFPACKSNTTKITQASISQNGTQNRVKTINSSETKTLLTNPENVVILDVRTPEEFHSGHLKNAVLIDKNDPGFKSKIRTLDRNKAYVVYCAKGGRSGQATELMQTLGFKDIYDATEGFEQLKAAGIPTEVK